MRKRKTSLSKCFVNSVDQFPFPFDQIYDNEEEAEVAYKTYAGKMGFSIHRVSSQGKNGHLVFRSFQCNCYTSVTSNSTSSLPSCRTKCPFRFTLRPIKGDSDPKYRVSSMNLEHNHSLCLSLEVSTSMEDITPLQSDEKYWLTQSCDDHISLDLNKVTSQRRNSLKVAKVLIGRKRKTQTEVRAKSRKYSAVFRIDQSSKGSEIDEGEGDDEEKDELSHMSGNMDDLGSVPSAVLDEDVCLQCGSSTRNDTATWDNIILCDVCDGEYHLTCIGLTEVPEDSFTCNKCIREKKELGDLRIQLSDAFAYKATDETTTDEKKCVCYSPSRPLAVAFEECKLKGFMVVSELFSYDLIIQLLYGSFHKLTKSGRTVESWFGAIAEVEKRLSPSSYSDIVDRDGRYDMRLPDYVISELKIRERLDPVLSVLRSIMSRSAEIRTHNVVFVPIGSKAQQWHWDDSSRETSKGYRYFTVLIHLNSLDSMCGGTEIWSKKLDRTDLIRARPGDALVFNGSLMHRGQGNLGRTHRLFYYCSFSCGEDENTGGVVR